MIDLEYSLIIKATEKADYFGFYCPDLEGFTGYNEEKGKSRRIAA